MQTRIKLILVVFLLVGVFGCGANDEAPPPTPTELAEDLLVGNWTLDNGGHILVDGQDVGVNYPGFELSLSFFVTKEDRYETINAGSLFKPFGIWSWGGFNNNNNLTFNLDDLQSISIVNLTDSTFNFTFQFAGTGGTANGVGGNYDILLVR